MTLRTLVLALTFSAVAAAQGDPWKRVDFLVGTWEAKTSSGTAGADALGTYTFRKELAGHILARHSSTDTCKGPADFDCDHGDLLYIYQDAPQLPLKAIYFDGEGHVIHYALSFPAVGSVEFLSEAGPGPQFRLLYNLKGTVMDGKFQMQMPGQKEWKSYLEWSGKKK